MCNLVNDEPEIFDARSFAPAERHRMIFEILGELDVGESFILISDHDPKPLFQQFEAERPREFSWIYLERSEVEWQVRIDRIAIAA